MEERKTYTDEELSAVLEKHRVMLSVGTFIMYAAVVVILGGTLACAVFEIEERRYSRHIGFFIEYDRAVPVILLCISCCTRKTYPDNGYDLCRGLPKPLLFMCKSQCMETAFPVLFHF